MSTNPSDGRPFATGSITPGLDPEPPPSSESAARRARHRWHRSTPSSVDPPQSEESPQEEQPMSATTQEQAEASSTNPAPDDRPADRKKDQTEPTAAQINSDDKSSRSRGALLGALALTVLGIVLIAGAWQLTSQVTAIVLGIILIPLTIAAWINWHRSDKDHAIPQLPGRRRNFALAMKALHLDGLVPPQGQKELDEIERQRQERQEQANQAARQRRIKELEEAVHREAHGRRGVITIPGNKGGMGKSSRGAYESTVLRRVAKVEVAFVDVNRFGGTSADYTGIQEGETLTLREFDEFRSQVPQDKPIVFADIASLLRRTSEGVMVIASDDVVYADDKFAAENITALISLMRDNAQFVFVDPGNDIASEFNLAVVQSSDHLSFPALPAPPFVKGCRNTRKTYKQQGPEYAEKVDNSTTAIYALENGETAEDYREQLGLMPDEELHGVPYDPYIKSMKPVDIDQLQPETYEAILEGLLKQLRRLPRLEKPVFKRQSNGQIPADSSSGETPSSVDQT